MQKNPISRVARNFWTTPNLWALILLLLGAHACSKDKVKPIVVRRTIISLDIPGKTTLEKTEVLNYLHTADGHFHLFQFREGNNSGAVLHLKLQKIPNPDSEKLVFWADLRVKMEEGKSGKTYESTGQSEGKTNENEAVENNEDSENDGANTLSAIKEALKGIYLQRKTELIPTEEVIAMLSDADPEVRDIAVRELGNRNGENVISALIKQLDDVEPISSRAIGALVAVGNEKAVDAMIKYGSRVPSYRLGGVFFALASLGGRVAEGYLFSFAFGTNDMKVRDLAMRALQDLRKRKVAEAGVGGAGAGKENKK